MTRNNLTPWLPEFHSYSFLYTWGKGIRKFCCSFFTVKTNLLFHIGLANHDLHANQAQWHQMLFSNLGLQISYHLHKSQWRWDGITNSAWLTEKLWFAEATVDQTPKTDNSLLQTRNGSLKSSLIHKNCRSGKGKTHSSSTCLHVIIMPIWCCI